MPPVTIRPETLFVLLGFVVPGYVWACVEHWIAPQFKIAERDKFLRYIAYSTVVAGLCFSLFFSTSSSDTKVHDWAFKNPLGTISALTFFAIVLGFVTGTAKRSDRIKKLFNRLGYAPPYSPETGWDRAFDRESPCQVAVTCEDDSVIHGYFYADSIASTAGDERDIYLQQTLFFNDDGLLEPDDESEGIWIPAREIKRIELFTPSKGP
jgi:hypothetical protein